MRTITDSAGVAWTVFEVRKQGGSAERWSYLPDEFGSGWLCFESSVSKRRLAPIPTQWREFSEPQLAHLLAQAKPVNRPNFILDDRATAE
jgi:hypothetical protein